MLPEGVIYLDGNSLGALPPPCPGGSGPWSPGNGAGTWSAWNADGWWTAPERIGDRIGALIGAAPGQTVAGDSTSVQLFNAVMASARARSGRSVILTEAGQFPTDGYMSDSVARLIGREVARVSDPLAALRTRGGTSRCSCGRWWISGPVSCGTSRD